MIHPTQHASADELKRLIKRDDDGSKDREIAAHLESCAHCRERLEDLAGDEFAEREACEMLGEYPWEQLQTSRGLIGATSASNDAWLPERSQEFDFLDRPSHPELLGRLGRYDVERVIGAGGMGVVFKGFDAELNRPVAIKVLASHLARNGSARQRFARESRAAAAVVHEHVVTIHNVESDRETPFLVMQYVAGESLQDKIDREGPLPGAQILRIGMQAAAGLAAAHEQGVVHRDIKPANILLENGIERTLLTDFGLARTVDDASLTCTGVLAGTPHYMSPEQANGELVDHRTDLFSLGSVLYFMATGKPPFRAEKAMGVLHRICHHRHRSACDFNPDIDHRLSDLIDELLDKKPSRRPNSASQVRQRLCEQLASRRTGRRRTWFSSVRRLLRRNRTTFLLACIGAAIASLSAVIPIGPSQRHKDRSEAHQEPRPTGPTAAESHDETSYDREAEHRALQAVEQSLLQAEEARLAKDAYQDDSLWSQEVQSVHESLDRLHEGVLPE